MKKVKIILFLAFVFLLLALSVFAAQMSSSNYKQNVIVSEGGENAASSSYKMSIAVGIINSVIDSASYINKLGFFHLLLLADNQPCTLNNQCEGGFCCSNLCSSSSCPTAAAAGGGGGAAAGGGGGVLPELKKDFSVSPSSIKEHIALGSTKTVPINIKNTGDLPLDFSLNVNTISDFVSLSNTSFSLAASQQKTIEANIIGKKLGSYIGEISVEAALIKKTVSVIVEVASDIVLFDVKVDIPQAYKEVEPGSELKVQITLLNVGPGKRVDVTPTYIIKDKQGKVIYESTETFAVEKQASYARSFKMPKDLEPGDYLMIVEVRYENSFAVSSELFKVVPKQAAVEKAARFNTALLFASMIFVGLVFLFMYLLVPRVTVFGKLRIKKCYKTINDAIDCLNSNDIRKAKKLYAEARKLYDTLDKRGKKEVYDELVGLYNKLK